MHILVKEIIVIPRRVWLMAEPCVAIVIMVEEVFEGKCCHCHLANTGTSALEETGESKSSLRAREQRAHL